jgi:hypothetical protein
MTIIYPDNISMEISMKLPEIINNLALKLPRELVSGLLGIKPFATNK